MRSYQQIPRFPLGLCALTALIVSLAAPASAHCDGMDGPVVKAAQAALEQGNVNLVLIWVQKDDEAELQRAFEQTVAVRKLGPQAKQLADTYFFETLVRIHRAGEGAPFTGLKPAGRDLGPAIPAADAALKSGDVTPLVNVLIDRVRAGTLEHFEQAMAAKNYKAQDVSAGREFVENYVKFMHYAEGIFEAAAHPVEGHYPEADASTHKAESTHEDHKAE